MLGMKRSLLGIVLCATLFLALVFGASADVGMRVVNGQVTYEQVVKTYSLIMRGDVFTATFSVGRPAFARVEFYTVTGTISSCEVQAIQVPGPGQ